MFDRAMKNIDVYIIDQNKPKEFEIKQFYCSKGSSKDC